MSEAIVLSWSGGKDSALALREIRRSAGHHVVALLTTITADHDRVSMHGVRRALLERQAASVGLPLHVMEIRAGAGNDAYELAMLRALEGFMTRGIRTIGFGDLFLRDVREYRENLAGRAGMKAIFPIWGRDTAALAADFIDSGFRAVLTCVDTHAVEPELAGRHYDHRLLEELPASADPCGENGEFHTFVTAGPGLAEEVPVVAGARVLRDGRFMFCDLTTPGTADRSEESPPAA